ARALDSRFDGVILPDGAEAGAKAFGARAAVLREKERRAGLVGISQTRGGRAAGQGYFAERFAAENVRPDKSFVVAGKLLALQLAFVLLLCEIGPLKVRAIG